MSNRIDIAITENVVRDATQAHVANITELATGFVFGARAYGGYSTAAIDIVCDEVTAYQFLVDHVGRRVVFTNPLAPDSEWIVWEGLIYAVTVDDANASTSRSLVDVYNRVTVTYSTIDSTVSPPILGLQGTTAEANDTTSQALYGIRQLSRVIGGSTSTEAGVLRDRLLADYKNPRAAASGVIVGVAAPSQLALRVECLGFGETLNNRFYSMATTTSAALDAIIKAVLTSVGQFVNSDQTNITANTYTRGQYQDGSLPARDYIDGLAALGDGATARRTFWGVFEQRKFFYYVEAAAAEYYIRKRDSGYRCYDATTGAEVMPWLIRPGKIAQMVDLLPDAVNYTTELDNVRSFVIGSVMFQAPYTAVLTPLTGVSSDIVIARMGMSRIGSAGDIIITGGPRGGVQEFGGQQNTASGEHVLEQFSTGISDEVGGRDLYGGQLPNDAGRC